jgi:hypothetical protein
VQEEAQPPVQPDPQALWHAVPHPAAQLVTQDPAQSPPHDSSQPNVQSEAQVLAQVPVQVPSQSKGRGGSVWEEEIRSVGEVSGVAAGSSSIGERSRASWPPAWLGRTKRRSKPSAVQPASIPTLRCRSA